MCSNKNIYDKLTQLFNKAVRYRYDKEKKCFKECFVDGNGQIVDVNDQKCKFPEKCVYVMFEKSEKYNNGPLYRVVRIGESRSTYNRMKNHFTKHGKSILREYVKSSLIHKDKDALKKISDPEAKAVEYIQDNITFVVIDLDDKTDKERKRIEQQLIRVFSKGKASEEWLGKHCYDDENDKNGIIREGCLWNVDGVPMKEGDLLNAINIGLVTIKK